MRVFLDLRIKKSLRNIELTLSSLSKSMTVFQALLYSPLSNVLLTPILSPKVYKKQWK